MEMWTRGQPPEMGSTDTAGLEQQAPPGSTAAEAEAQKTVGQLEFLLLLPLLKVLLLTMAVAIVRSFRHCLQKRRCCGHPVVAFENLDSAMSIAIE